MRVSIVIAAYNAGSLIESSVRSALAQTHPDIEVLVVDDGSRDETADVVSAIDDSRVRLIRQENKGQSSALNRGAREGAGEYIKFLDADDFINPSHIAAQLDALQGSIDKLASCRWGYFRNSPEVSLVRDEPTNRDYDNPVDWIVDSLTRAEGMMGGWMWLIPRGLFEKAGGWNESLSLNNDFDFSIRLLLASSGVRFARGAVYSYREGVHGSLSATRGAKAMESAFNTTEYGCTALLERENSPRTRRVCADRWQRWQYWFYPERKDLAEQAGERVKSLGGSDLQMEGGRLLHVLLPIVGWKAARTLQTHAYESGWSAILEWKRNRRLARIEAGAE
jgi:glycosyltransferase involved in cell wall biosynthesis